MPLDIESYFVPHFVEMWATFFGGDEVSEPFSAENPAQDIVKEEQSTDGMEESPMSMLLKRMNQLLVQVGELEFEKKSVAEKVRIFFCN